MLNGDQEAKDRMEMFRRLNPVVSWEQFKRISTFCGGDEQKIRELLCIDKNKGVKK